MSIFFLYLSPLVALLRSSELNINIERKVSNFWKSEKVNPVKDFTLARIGSFPSWSSTEATFRTKLPSTQIVLLVSLNHSKSHQAIQLHHKLNTDSTEHLAPVGSVF